MNKTKRVNTHKKKSKSNAARELEMQQLRLALEHTEQSIKAHQKTLGQLYEKKARQFAELCLQKLLGFRRNS